MTEPVELHDWLVRNPQSGVRLIVKVNHGKVEGVGISGGQFRYVKIGDDVATAQANLDRFADGLRRMTIDKSGNVHFPEDM